MTNRKMRVLCLHGKRTSGNIMKMQTSAMRYHTPMDCDFIDAPFLAEGPPDEGIQNYYPDYKYYEWFYRRKDDNDVVSYEGLNQSIEMVQNYLRTNGPFDGILGFSQGGGFINLLAYLQHNKLKGFKDDLLFHFVILIGSIEPMNISKEIFLCDLPSLHIIGKADSYYSRSTEVVEFYKKNNKDNTKLLLHEEGHQIPSIRTGLYPHITNWIHSLDTFSIHHHQYNHKDSTSSSNHKDLNNKEEITSNSLCHIC